MAVLDRAALLAAHAEARAAAVRRGDAVVLSAPRLSGFPRVPERVAECGAPILAAELSARAEHAGRALHVTTISDASVLGSTVTAVAEDADGAAVYVVLHHFAADPTLAGAARALPRGTALEIRAPYYADFPGGAALSIAGVFAVCCAHPGNVHGAPRPPPPPPAAAAADPLEVLVAAGRYREAAKGLMMGGRRDRAAEVLQLLRESEQGAYDWLRLHTEDAAGPARFACAPFWSPRAEVRASEARGRGVFAVGAWAPGELVLAAKAEHVLFTAELAGRRLWRAPGWDEDGEDCAADTLLVQHLAARGFDELLALSRGAGERSTAADAPALLRLAEVVQANRFTAFEPWEGAVRGTGLWAGASRLNHACDANCSWATVGDMLFIRAQRAIAVGEELTIAYVSPTETLTERRRFLERRHGFVCTCALCVAQSAGDPGAAAYERAVARGQHARAFALLEAPAYCSLRHAQAEHALAAYAAGGGAEWLARAEASFALAWGGARGVFALFAAARGA